MKYDSNLIGERVITFSNKEGKITKIDNEGFISIRFDKDVLDKTFMYNPFLKGDIKFLNADLQKKVDSEIEQKRNEKLEIIKNAIVNKTNKETFYVTKDNADSTKEVIYKLSCEKEIALIVFSFVVSEQQKERRESNYAKTWRIVRLFDSNTGEQICQES